MASAEDPSEGPKHKIVALKVSVHCGGCKKKIEKILSKTHDVYEFDIDASKKKVTVLGNVDADTLIKKLAKAGKKAELWPEKTPANINAEKKDEKGPTKSKESQQKSAEEKPTGDGNAASAPGAAALDSGENKSEVAEASTPPTEKPAAAAVTEKQEEKAPSDPNENSSGSRKKKGKKVQKEGGGEFAAKKSDSSSSAASVGNIEPPFQHLQPAPAPAYLMSYSMSQPSVSHAYYAPPMQATSAPGYSYAQYDSYYQPYPPAPADYFYGTADGGSSSQQQHSYVNFFSEENPNGCSLM